MTLPRGWVDVTVADVAIISSGFGFPKEFQGSSEGEIPFAKVSDVSRSVAEAGGVLRTAVNFVSPDQLATLKAKTIPAGSTVFAKIGEAVRLNRRAITDKTLVVDNNVMALTPIYDLCDPFFLHRWMHTIELGPLTVATTVPSVRSSDVAALNFLLPPLDEQRRIVAKLNTVTSGLARARAELDRVPVLAEHLRQSAVFAAFSGQLTNSWRTANAGLEASSPAECERAYLTATGQKRRKPALEIDWQPDLSIPNSWRWVSVDQVVGVVQYGTSAKTSNASDGVPVLRMGNIQSGEIDWGSLKYLPKDHGEFPELFLTKGDVLFNRTNSFELVGKSAVYRGSTRPASYASYLIRLRCTVILPDLLVRYLNSSLGRTWVEQVASQQVGQANVNGSKLKAMAIPLPPMAEQDELLRLLDLAFARADRLEAEAARARALLDRLEAATLAKAFRGELVPQDPSDEPASALLARISAQRADATKSKRGRR